VGGLFLLIRWRKLLPMLFWFLFFIIFRGMKVLTGGLVCGRMKSDYYLEAGGSAQ